MTSLLCGHLVNVHPFQMIELPPSPHPSKESCQFITLNWTVAVSLICHWCLSWRPLVTLSRKCHTTSIVGRKKRTWMRWRREIKWGEAEKEWEIHQGPSGDCLHSPPASPAPACTCFPSRKKEEKLEGVASPSTCLIHSLSWPQPSCLWDPHPVQMPTAYRFLLLIPHLPPSWIILSPHRDRPKQSKISQNGPSYSLSYCSAFPLLPKVKFPEAVLFMIPPQIHM